MLAKALARAWQWQTLPGSGAYGLVTEIAEAEKISKSYVSRILRLALLAPDIVEAIFGGWADPVILERVERPLLAVWRLAKWLIGTETRILILDHENRCELSRDGCGGPGPARPRPFQVSRQGEDRRWA